jgi:hypothetical protein
MSELVFLTPTVSLAAQNLTDNLKSATLTYDADAKEFTASGDGTREYLPGLKQWSVSLEFNQDYAANDVDEELFPIVGTEVAFALKPTSAAISATNPEYQGQVIVTSYQPLGGSIGEVVMAPVSLQGTGVLTRDVVA